MNNKIVVLVLLIALIVIGSASNGEKVGNPHIDNNLNVTVECVLCDTIPNCNNITPLIVEGDTIITGDMIEGFLCENGFVLFSERATPGELCQTWMTPGGEFVRVGLYEDLNGFPRLRIYDQVQYELKNNEVVLS